ncbi:hypothetical protein NAPIS_ORF02432 [Vairimorpha apis BRL 01]|uniref:Reverse transcriptase n=1 Tax=Vairimorpha apis BRL 01 TaxID=1037528 RepID=T0M9G1_9MICR|nr:hypothetical protein NAPIS_ORF02432 [Vairimorpha apis BRL 01]
MATRCEKMLGHDYIRRHNEIVKWKILRTYSVKLIVVNKLIEIRVDTTIKTDIKIKYNKLDIVVIDKKSKEILIVEIRVKSIDSLQQEETEKLKKYDLLANELGLIHGCKTRIIPYVLTWDGIVTKYHAKYRKALEISDRIKAYIQSVTLKKTLESVSLEYKIGEDLILVESERNENVHLSELVL